jgi:O-acetyl-ADP-ribose deacetylase
VKVSGCRISFVQGDITEQHVEAIVNAANMTLMGGGGVDGAIHRKGGPRILEECKAIRAEHWPDGLPTGKAVSTTGGDLNAKYVIHTVGPVWRGGRAQEAELLGQCYTNSLSLARSSGIRTIAFPSISTGAYGYPVEQASRVALRAVKSFLEHDGGGCIEGVVFVLFSRPDLEEYRDAAGML